MIKDEEYYNLLVRIEKLERKVRKLDTKTREDPFKEDIKMYEVLSTKTRRKDKTMYKIDGTVFDKRNLVRYVVHKICEEKRPSSENELFSYFPNRLGGSLGTLTIYEIARRYKDFPKRYFTNDTDLIRINNKVYCINKDWNTTNIKKFIDNARALNLEIEIMSDRRNDYE